MWRGVGRAQDPAPHQQGPCGADEPGSEAPAKGERARSRPSAERGKGTFNSFFKDFIYSFLDRREGKEKGREKERERNINVWLTLVCPLLGSWPATQACALTGNRSGDTLVLRWVPNPLSHTSQGETFNSLKSLLRDILATFQGESKSQLQPALEPNPGHHSLEDEGHRVSHLVRLLSSLSSSKHLILRVRNTHSDRETQLVAGIDKTQMQSRAAPEGSIPPNALRGPPHSNPAADPAQGMTAAPRGGRRGLCRQSGLTLTSSTFPDVLSFQQK